MSKLHIFDMNKTLIKVDSNATWKEFLAKQGIISGAESKQALQFSSDYDAGKLDEKAFFAAQFAGFNGKSKPEMAKLAALHFEECLKPAVNQAAFDYVKKLIRSGEQTAILTTSNTLVAATVALHFGIADFIACEPELKNDIFTGKPAGTFPGVYGKIFSVGRYCERFNFCASDLVCYADSISDLKLLETVGTPVAVNPSAELRKYAEAAKWQIFDWAN